MTGPNNINQTRHEGPTPHDPPHHTKKPKKASREVIKQSACQNDPKSKNINSKAHWGKEKRGTGMQNDGAQKRKVTTGVLTRITHFFGWGRWVTFTRVGGDSVEERKRTARGKAVEQGNHGNGI